MRRSGAVWSRASRRQSWRRLRGVAWRRASSSEAPPLSEPYRKLQKRIHPDRFQDIPTAQEANERAFQTLAEYVEACCKDATVSAMLQPSNVFPLFVKEEGTAKPKAVTARLRYAGADASANAAHLLTDLEALFDACGIKPSHFCLSDAYAKPSHGQSQPPPPGAGHTSIGRFMISLGKDGCEQRECARHALLAHQAAAAARDLAETHLRGLGCRIAYGGPLGGLASVAAQRALAERLQRVLQRVDHAHIATVVVHTSPEADPLAHTLSGAVDMLGRVHVYSNTADDAWIDALGADPEVIRDARRRTADARTAAARAAKAVGVRQIFASARLETGPAMAELISELASASHTQLPRRCLEVPVHIVETGEAHVDAAHGVVAVPVTAGAAGVLDAAARLSGRAARAGRKSARERDTLHRAALETRRSLMLERVHVQPGVAPAGAIECCARLTNATSALAPVLWGLRLLLVSPGQSMRVCTDSGAVVVPLDW